MWADKLKLSKQLVRTVTEAGFNNPKEVQLKTLARIAGGQDLLVAGPEGCGKTTTYVLAVLNRIKQGFGDAPRVLILVENKEKVEAVSGQFKLFNKNKSLQIVGLYPAPGIEAQMDALADGSDVVVATPDRARAIYLKLGLNLNKVELLIVDDADLIIKQGMQLPVAELANSIAKAQHLVFTEVVHDKLWKMIDPFMKLPATVEVEELSETDLVTYEQLLYQVPNFRTKLNLLYLFLADAELFTKAIVFANTVFTAEKLYKSLQQRLKHEVALFNPEFFDVTGFKDLFEFKASTSARILIVANENSGLTDVLDIPFILHFELPLEQEIFIKRVTNPSPQEKNETLAITFATDLELNAVKKIEQAIGQKIPVAALPDDLHIEKEQKPETEEKKAVKVKNPDPEPGTAFHEKKASNAKTYNFSSGEKAKMNNKRKH
ncbi:DEAD/DEAH box helicase [Mucilaginibacter arboris]|uniref:DEAD/DEAH box helicase n=1 Tax=Mucilaginibacter arboris TaxID=2682090 RepID=A0A7K1T1E7_9SPHI|nr:DEAD/DEAH box helicase [Mucilaginibacter arboris]MVN23403.1 DEAD/DEAH box helicase [Mucilaginibacter arboris]